MIGRTTSLCTNPSVKRTGGSLWLLRSLALAAALCLLTWGGVALAADPCLDGDTDGYYDCTGGCDDTGLTCGDCNDGAGSINPGETEKCDIDNIDENCDGSHNEGYDPLGREGDIAGEGYDCADGLDNDGDGFTDGNDPQCLDAMNPSSDGGCELTDPPGCMAGDPGGCCVTVSFTQCTFNGSTTTTCPIPPGGIEMHALEGPAPDASCSDFEDNDCDGVIDVGEAGCQETETCNNADDDGSGRESGASMVFDCNDNVDNDLDGDVDNDDDGCKAGVDDTFKTGMMALGSACTAGVGECENTGAYVCAPGGMSTTCSALPLSSKIEGPPGSATCSDGLDNDCDNKADLTGAMMLPADDDSCVEAEKCDGVDNDGNGEIDTDVFTDLGDACSAGEGICSTPGVRVCRPDQLDTVCNAVPGVASTEGPSGPTCLDDLDNDCDGDEDEDDPGCGSQFLTAECSLPRIRSLPGDDCTQWRRINFSAGGGSENTIVTAEILAIDTEGNILASVPVVQGDRAHMASRLPSTAWKWTYELNAKLGNRAEVFAPVPLLRVTAKDGLNKATAYCSIIPYMQVFEPTGQVITSGSGDTMHFEAAISQMSPGSLSVKVDGVLLFPNMVPPIDPMTAFPGGPYNGTIMIGTELVEVLNLKVSSKVVEQLAGNVLTFDLKGMGCGQHIIVADGDKRPGVFPDKVSSTCLVDDLHDRGNAATFQVEIESPTDQSSQAVPTTVMGNVCHGLEIADLKVNNKDVSTAGQTSMTADAGTEDERTTVTLNFMTSLDQTDLAADLDLMTTDVDSFDAGSNRAVADATDAEGHRAFDDVIFSTGDVANPGTPLTLTAGDIEQQIQAQIAERLNEVAAGMPTTYLTDGPELENAFVVGIKEQAIADFMQNKCNGVAQEFADRARAAIFAKPPIVKSIPVPCSCDPPVSIVVTNVEITVAQNSCPIDFVHDFINVTVNLPDIAVTTHVGGWCKTTFLGACIDKTVVDMDVKVTLTGIHFGFQITEDQMKGNPGPPADPLVISGSTSTTVGGGFWIHCIGADICNVLAEVFTFGAIDLSPDLNFTQETDFTKEVGAEDPDPISLGEIKLNELAIQQKEQSAKGMLEEVAIEEGGMTATLKGTFATGSVDPSIEETPGAVLTLPNLLPATPLASADDVYIGVADDVFNQLFASMAISGKLKTDCVSDPNDPITVSDLLPADCTTISIPLDTPEATEAAESAAIGLCVGLKQGDCDTLGSENFLLTPVEQGVCHGFKGDNCLALAGGLVGFPWPADCESIVLDIPSLPGLSDRISALAQGLCHADNGDDCQTLSNTTDDLTGIEQGACSGATGADCQTLAGVFGSLSLEKATCEGVKGVNACNTLPLGQPLECTTTLVVKAAINSLFVLAEQEACNASPNLNIHGPDEVLFCSRADVPPRLLIQDDTSTDAIETAIRLNDLSVGLVVDRDSDGLDGELAATPGCFGTGAPSTGDCSLFGLCLDLNFVTQMQFGTCTDGQPGLLTAVQDILATIRRAGVVCDAAMAGADGPVVAEGATSMTIDLLMHNVDEFTPPACADGFDLGDTVTFSAPRLMAIETDGNMEFQDYLAITGQINP